jgi:hypothetical protein
MLKLTPASQFKTQVLLSRPGHAEGVPVEFTFRHKNRTEYAKWVAKLGNDATDDEVLHEVIVDWQGICDDEGEPIAYALSNLQRLMENYPASRHDIFNKYQAEVLRSKQKNF